MTKKRSSEILPIQKILVREIFFRPPNSAPDLRLCIQRLSEKLTRYYSSTISCSICYFTHYATISVQDLRRLVKNIRWANQNIGGKVVKSEKCMGVS